MNGEKEKSETTSRKSFPIIPPEIIKSLESSLGYSWLIKGEAGAGKTTFALTLLNQLRNHEPIYLSTRVAPISLYKQFPFLKDHLDQTNILDATRTYLPPVHEEKGSRMKDHFMRTIQYSSLPDLIKIIYEKVDKYENPVIVIDSWDAILGLESSKENKAENMETLLTEFIRQTNSKLILIAESNAPSYLDYIVDGILTISDTFVDNRTIRILTINKIRAVERKQKNYVFSLHNNQFNVCMPFEHKVPKKIEKWQPVPDDIDLFSTGSRSLDKLYQGGLRQGTFNLVEIESNVPITAYSPIIISAICNFIAHKRGVIVHTMDGINSPLVDKKRLFLYLDTDDISKYLRIIAEKVSDRTEIRPYIIQTTKEDFNRVFFQTYAKLSSISKFQPVFAAVSYNSMQFMVDFEESIADLYQHIKLIRNSNVIEMGIINTYSTTQPTKDRMVSLSEDISYISNTHIKIIERNGAVFIYGIKPRTYLYHLITDYSKGNPQIYLLPIV